MYKSTEKERLIASLFLFIFLETYKSNPVYSGIDGQIQACPGRKKSDL
jgi:hypothetical protein